MATKKRRRKTSGRKRPMSESAKRTVRRSRGKRRGRGMSSKIGLSEAFNPATVTHTGKGMLTGAIVGYGIASVEPIIDTMPKWAQHATMLGGSFIAGAILKMDKVSGAIATVWGYKLAKEMQTLNDDADWADEDSLSEEVEYMDESGNPMFLADDGNFYYLEDGDEDEDEMLEEDTYLADGIEYPAYANVDRY